MVSVQIRRQRRIGRGPLQQNMPIGQKIIIRQNAASLQAQLTNALIRATTD